MDSDLCDSLTVNAPTPSSKLLHAALAGLLALSATGCGDDSRPPGSPAITSTQHVENVDADSFKVMCDARDGTVEVMAHCNGLATGPGFAYDVTTSELAEHTCKGANTCAGWNCLTGGSGS